MGRGVRQTQFIPIKSVAQPDLVNGRGDYIYIYTTCSIYLLTCSNVGPLEDACARLGGNARKRQRVDSEIETHVKKLRAWANEWPIRGRVVGTLEVFYDR